MATATKKKTSARKVAPKKTAAKKSTAKRSASNRSPMSKKPSTRSRGMQPKGMKTSSRKSSTSRAKNASKAAGSKGTITTDDEEIREWAEARNGTPASVLGTRRGKEEAGLLRIDFPGYSGKESLCPIEWNEFFEKFEESNLAFLHGGGKRSRFNKFIAREGSPRSKSRRK